MLATFSPPGDDDGLFTLPWSGSSFVTNNLTPKGPKTCETLTISARAIETLLGWVGQVWVGPDISWEGESWESAEQAMDEARMRVVHVLRNANVE